MVVSEEQEIIPLREAIKRFRMSRQAFYDAFERGYIRRYDRPIGRDKVFVDARQVERVLQPKPREDG